MVWRKERLTENRVKYCPSVSNLFEWRPRSRRNVCCKVCYRTDCCDDGDPPEMQIHIAQAELLFLKTPKTCLRIIPGSGKSFFASMHNKSEENYLSTMSFHLELMKTCFVLSIQCNSKKIKWNWILFSDFEIKICHPPDTHARNIRITRIRNVEASTTSVLKIVSIFLSHVQIFIESQIK